MGTLVSKHAKTMKEDSAGRTLSGSSVAEAGRSSFAEVGEHARSTAAAHSTSCPPRVEPQWTPDSAGYGHERNPTIAEPAKSVSDSLLERRQHIQQIQRKDSATNATVPKQKDRKSPLGSITFHWRITMMIVVKI